MTNQPFSTGVIRSPKDYRDVPLVAVPSVADGSAYPSAFFVPVGELPVWHQKKIGSCVGHGAGKYKQMLEKTETGQIFDLSPRFLYAVAKCLDGYQGEGTYLRLMAKILQKYGMAT
jgi:hypothetical protein